MRIDDLRYPILERIKNKNMGVVGYHESMRENMNIRWKAYNEIFEWMTNFTYEAYLITKPFLSSICKKEIKERLWFVLKDIPSEAGVILYNGLTIMFQIENTDFIYSRMMFFEGDKFIGFYDGKINKETDAIYESNYNFCFSKNEDMDGVNEWVFTIYIFILFKKFADVEVKILPKKSGAEIFKCKYSNDTKSNIKIMDCTWFTTLVQSEGFNVRGHLRFQAYGEGMKQKKLIWINDFTKAGYIRKAKILVKYE